MKEKQSKLFLIIVTICISLILLVNLIDGLTTGNWGSPIVNICFAAGAVSLIIAWVDYFKKQKNQK